MSCFDIKRTKEEMGDIKDEMLALQKLSDVEERSFSEDEFSKLAELREKYDELENQVKTAEAKSLIPSSKKSDIIVAQRSYSPKQEVITRSDTNKATKAWLTRNSANFKEEYSVAADKCDFAWNSPSMNVQLLGNGEDIKTRSQTVGTTTAGGHSVSDEVVGGFEEALLSYWSWQPHVTTHRTTTNGPFRIVTMDDSTSSAAYEAELAAISNANLTFGEAVFNSYKLTSGLYAISNELLEDNEIGVGAMIGNALGTRLARTLSSEITNGDGTAHLDGFTNGGVTVGVTATAVAVIDQDELIDLYFSVGDAYRTSAIWQMHSLVLAAIVKLEDGNGRKLFGPGLDGSPQGMLMGKPIVVNDNLPSVLQANAIPVYFGDFSSVHVRIVRDVSIRESSEKYFLEDAKAYIATMRCDSQYVNAGTDPIKSLKMAAA